MFIQSNIEAMQTYQNLTRIDSAFNKSLAKVSSGLALPKPQFGGGLFAVANDMEALYQEYTTGAKNVQDAQGLLEVAQTTMMEVNEMVLQMNDLAHRAATDTVNDDQRVQMDTEFQQLMINASNLMLDVKYNDLSVWTAAAQGQTFSIVFGENDSFTITTSNMAQADLGYNGQDITTAGNAVTAMGVMDTSVNTMSQLLATMGAQISEIEGKVNILNEQAVQQKAMESRINELDFAVEMKNFTSLQVVLQASNAMVSQANMKAQMVMQLFG